tara:strand:- start:10 stop:177 length:168 start_codon:yes stop_codon:yes gene_type:complete
MILETGNLTRKDTLTKIGNNRTTMGVLFINALRIAATKRVKIKAINGLDDQVLVI